MPTDPRRPRSDTSSPFDIAAAVAEFHRAFGLPTRERPGTDVDQAWAKLRVALLEEEVAEFVAAPEKG